MGWHGLARHSRLTPGSQHPALHHLPLPQLLQERATKVSHGNTARMAVEYGDDVSVGCLRVLEPGCHARMPCQRMQQRADLASCCVAGMG